MTGLKWTSKTLRKLVEELESYKIHANKDSVGKIMREMGYSLRVNSKNISMEKQIDRTTRNQQFNYIGTPI